MKQRVILKNLSKEEAITVKILNGDMVYREAALEMGISKQGAINMFARMCRLMFNAGRLRFRDEKSKLFTKYFLKND